ncbi:helix-turn-helix domain-containing protein [Pseudonocardia sichuanensis]
METVAATVARNVAEMRDRRRMSVRAVSARMAELGHKMLPSVVSKIETGERKVTVTELVLFALVFGVGPLRLLLPADGDEVAFAPGRVVPWSSAWSWATGEHPLESATSDEVDDFERENRPHHAKARSREILRWEEQLGPLREAVQQMTAAGVPDAVIRGYVDFRLTLKAVLPAAMEQWHREQEGTDGGR